MILQLNQALSGRYLVERQIGAGGMANVYVARDLRHERRVALKVLKPELGALLGVDRFLSEIRVTANLQHPNILPLFDSGEASGHLFYVMPFVEGESLRARLDRERQLPVDEAIRLSVAIATALEYAHTQGVIHRDLKPENVLLQAGQPVISDFGIALAVSNAGGTRVTQTGLSLGTPQYMSPEQATGDRSIDARSDIYSLAALTYEMISGEPPHTGNTAQAVIARLLTESPRSLRSTRMNVPEQVEQAVDRGLAKLPADRWSAAREFAEAIQGRIAARPAQADVRHAASGFFGRLRRDSSNPVVLGLIALTVVSTSAAAWLWTTDDSPAAARSTRFMVAPTRDVSLPVTQGASVAISPDGGTVAFVARGTLRRNQLFIRRQEDLGPVPLEGSVNGGALSFSPDGQWLAYVQNAKLRMTSISTGAVVDITDLGGAPSGLAWVTPDQIVISVGTHLVVQPARGGPRDTLSQLPGEVAREWPRAVGDGEHVLYASWPEGNDASKARIAIMSLRTGASRILDAFGVCPLGVVGEMLLYVTGGEDVMAVRFDMKRMRVSGDPRPVERGVILGSRGSCKAAVSPGGTLVLQRKWASSQLLLRNDRGLERVLLGEPKPYAHPRFSPDGKRIALTIQSGPRSDIWIHDVSDGTTLRLTDQGTVNERPEWSPDGSRVLFRSDAGARSGIWWRPVDKSEPAKPLLLLDRAPVYEAVFTSDGSGLVFQLDTSGADVMYKPLRGDTALRPIAVTPFAEDRARPSPDGKWVAFADFTTVSSQVVVRSLDGTGGQVQVSTDLGTEPIWAPDGRTLIYRDGLSFMAATLETQPRFRVKARRILFDDNYVFSAQPHASYDVSPDGSQFLLLKQVEPSELIVVQNVLARLNTEGVRRD